MSNANIEVVNSGNTRFTNAVSGDMCIYTDNTTQKIHVGTQLSTTSKVAIDTTGVTINGSLNATTLSNVVNFVGLVVPYAGSSAPTGWLICDGSAVSRTTYANLFSIISTTFGTGDGSTTFGLPDLRGRVIAGIDNMGSTGTAGRLTATSITNPTTRGSTGGADTVTLNQNQCALPSHAHTASAAVDGSHTHGTTENAHNHTLTDPGHTHQYSAPSVYGATSGGAGYANTPTTTTTTSKLTGITLAAATTGLSILAGGSHSHTITVDAASANAVSPVPLLQPTILLNYIIKV